MPIPVGARVKRSLADGTYYGTVIAKLGPDVSRVTWDEKLNADGTSCTPIPPRTHPHDDANLIPASCPN